MNKTNIQIIKALQEFLQSASTNQEKYCQKKTNFTRSRKLSFVGVALFLLNLPKKSLSIELADFYKILGIDALAAATKSAFSKARYKLKVDFFKDWHKVLLKAFYSDNEKRVKLWKGHTLLGVDGSTATLFNTEEVSTFFGRLHKVVMGRVMSCIDVLNGLCVIGKIAPIGESEMQIAKQWIAGMKLTYPYLINPLLIFDRGYAGFALAYMLMEAKLDFVIRYPLGFNQLVYDFMQIEAQDCVVDFPITQGAVEDLKALGYEVDEQTSIKVRLVKVELDTGETEVLMTSLLNEEKYPQEVFKELYFKRWGTETNYDYWKNKLQMEIYSGHTVKAIFQDFHAMIMTANLQSLIINECEPDLEQINKEKEGKFDYAVNKNVSLGLFKNRIVELFLLPDSAQILTQLKLLFLKHLELVRPGRSFKRDFKKHKINGKYVTFLNYRRAM